MGKRRRNTAKTGDKAIYRKARAINNNNSGKDVGADRDDDDDPMYDEVDRFHNRREEELEYLKLDDGGAESSSDEDDIDKQEAVMDLGVAGSDSEGESSDEDSDEDSDDDDDGVRPSRGRDERSESSGSSEGEASSSSDDDDDDELEMDEDDVRDWGKKKSAYYHGDTADLEIGQDEEDAFMEEEAAKEVQAARYKELSEEDFFLSDAEDQEKTEVDEGRGGREVAEKISTKRQVSKMSKKEKTRLLDKQHPELLPLLSYFSDVVEDLDQRTAVVTRALLESKEDGAAEAVGATKLGKQYLLTKALLQSSTALNLAGYLLIKSDQSSRGESSDPALIQGHPVMSRLQKWNDMAKKLEERVENNVDGLDSQVRMLVRAAAQVKSGDDDDDDDDDAESDSDVDGENESGEGARESDEKDRAARTDGDAEMGPGVSAAPASSSSDDDDGGENDGGAGENSIDEEAANRNVMSEARFGLRPGEISSGPPAKRSRRRGDGKRAAMEDLGDDDDDDRDAGAARASRSLAATLNSIEQRSASRKRRPAPLSEDLDEPREQNEQLRLGLEMMEAELGKLSDDDGDGEGRKIAAGDDDEMAEEEDDDDGDFYARISKKSKSKKMAKDMIYKVAPKYPRVEGEIDGERAASKTILKNRGLVAHKSKLNRNPRVKKREQYRKALIRRKGAVREVRTDEGHKYGGEQTGIKAGISRSRKLV